jgi:hypothetical protein
MLWHAFGRVLYDRYQDVDNLGCILKVCVDFFKEDYDEF